MAPNLRTSCRCCLKQEVNGLLVMSEAFLLEEGSTSELNSKILDKYFEVCVDPSLVTLGPCKICFSCREALASFITFRDVCRKSNEKYQNLWTEPVEPNIICTEVKITNDQLVSEVMIMEPKSEVKSEPESDDDQPDNVSLGAAADDSDDNDDAVPQSPIKADLEIPKARNNKQRHVIKRRNRTEVENLGAKKPKLSEPLVEPKIEPSEAEKFHQNLVENAKATFFCAICEFEYDDYNKFKRHTTVYHKKPKLIRRDEKDCNFCGQTKVKPYRKHLVEHHPDFKPNRCGNCTATFQTAIELMAHLPIHLDGQQHQCLGCKQFFVTKEKLRLHIGMVPHKTLKSSIYYRLYSCPECGMSFENMAGFDEHFHDQHPDVICYPCFYCKRIFLNMKNYFIHYRKECRYKVSTYLKKYADEAPTVGCPKCTEKFHEEDLMICHKLTAHTKSMYFCDICNINLMRRKEHYEHMNKHHPDVVKQQKATPYICSICGKQLGSVTSLKDHVKSVHDNADAPKSFKCDKCPAAFKTKDNLRLHELRHVQEKIFECNECGFKTVGLQYLFNHLVSQHFRSCLKFICNVCDRGFVSNFSLKRHMESHTGTQKFKCQFCDKKFASAAGAQCHIQSKHTSIRYECKFCDKKLASKTSMWKHVFVHRGYFPFNCPTCNYGCYPKELMKTHMKKHNMVFDDAIHGYHAETFDAVVLSGIKMDQTNASDFRGRKALSLNNDIEYLNQKAMEVAQVQPTDYNFQENF